MCQRYDAVMEDLASVAEYLADLKFLFGFMRCDALGCGQCSNERYYILSVIHAERFESHPFLDEGVDA